MELFGEIIGFLVFEILFTGIGWFCLYVRYRNLKKMKQIKDHRYAGAYSAVGKVMILNFIAAVGAIVTFGAAIFGLVAWVLKSVY